MSQYNQTELKCYCSACNHRTRHAVLGVDVNSYVDHDEGFYEDHIYRLVKCKGCDRVSFNLEKTGTAYELYDDEYGGEREVPEFTSYPQQEGEITPIDDSWSLPSQVYVPYYESINAINHKAYLLAALGLRMVVEAVCQDNDTIGEKLKLKIDNLRDKGIITAADCERLHEARFMGNESAHEIQTPDRDKLLIVLDIINGMLNNLYVLDKKYKEKFPYRFDNYQDFETKIRQSLARYHSGEQYTVYGFLPEDRKYDNSTLLKYEAQLKTKIADGSFTELRITANYTPNGHCIFEIV